MRQNEKFVYRSSRSDKNVKNAGDFMENAGDRELSKKCTSFLVLASLKSVPSNGRKTENR